MAKIKQAGTYANKKLNTQFFYAKGAEVADDAELELVSGAAEPIEADAKADAEPENKAEKSAPSNKSAKA